MGVGGFRILRGGATGTLSGGVRFGPETGRGGGLVGGAGIFLTADLGEAGDRGRRPWRMNSLPFGGA
mgnify:CR=1 FL=1